MPAPLAPQPVATSVAAALTLHVRLSNGDRIEAGAFDDETSAHIRARELATAFSGGDWALLNGRYVRPEAVVSIDVETA